MYVTGCNSEGNVGMGSPPQIKTITWNPFVTEKVKLISCGYYHTIILTIKNRLYSFGSSLNGQIGSFSYRSRSIPQELTDLPFDPKNVTGIVCGHSFSIIVTENKNLFVCGNNQSGQCGLYKHISDISKFDPHPMFCDLKIDFPQKNNKQNNISKEKVIKSLSCGGNHTIIIMNDNRVRGFGNNRFGQLCYSPSKLEQTHDVINIIVPLKHTQFIRFVECGFFSTFFVVTTYSTRTPKSEPIFSEIILACGENSHGSLGIGSCDKSTYILTPVEFPSDNIFVKKISCGDDHVLCLTNNGVLWVWGNATYGQLGKTNVLKNKNKVNKPVLYEPLLSRKGHVVDICARGNFSVVMYERENNAFHNEVVVFGANKNFQLGFPNYCDLPRRVNMTNEIVKVAMGFSHVCYVVKHQKDVGIDLKWREGINRAIDDCMSLGLWSVLCTRIINNNNIFHENVSENVSKVVVLYFVSKELIQTTFVDIKYIIESFEWLVRVKGIHGSYISTFKKFKYFLLACIMKNLSLKKFREYLFEKGLGKIIIDMMKNHHLLHPESVNEEGDLFYHSISRIIWDSMENKVNYYKTMKSFGSFGKICLNEKVMKENCTKFETYGYANFGEIKVTVVRKGKNKKGLKLSEMRLCIDKIELEEFFKLVHLGRLKMYRGNVFEILLLCEMFGFSCFYVLKAAYSIILRNYEGINCLLLVQNKDVRRKKMLVNILRAVCMEKWREIVNEIGENLSFYNEIIDKREFIGLNQYYLSNIVC